MLAFLSRKGCQLDESEAIQAIERLGGRIERDDTLPGSPVRRVDLMGSSDFGDRDIHLLTMLKSLKQLRLSGHNISDAGFLELGSLTGLTALEIFAIREKVTEVGLRQLWNLRSLVQLWLCAAHVMDATLDGIGRLQNLEELRLKSTRITGAGLGELKGLTHLASRSPTWRHSSWDGRESRTPE